MKDTETSMETIISLAKRRGFIFQSSEVYGGLAGAYDYGPYGRALKENIKQVWWKRFVADRTDMYGMDASVLMNRKVWEASGHVGGFADPLVEDTKTKRRFRADHLLEDAGVDATGLSFDEIDKALREHAIKSPDGNDISGVREFNMMFRTQVGATENEDAQTFLRPETAQGMFVNFKNIVDSLYPDMPFGLAQMGKVFRNEIAPRDFLFRVREFEQMEVEYFVREDDWERAFEEWREVMWAFIDDLGLSRDRVHELEVPEADLAHYSKRTIDFEYDYPFGRKELYGLAYRTDHDLQSHMKASGVSFEYIDKQTQERFVPHVIEPSLGVDRTVLAVLCSAYREDMLGDETRSFLALPPALAPMKVAVFPLLKNKPELIEKATNVFQDIKKAIPEIIFDDNGNIGKRYRRQDEIGTPLCVTVDFDSLEDDTVTVRFRDTGEQERVARAVLNETLTRHIHSSA